MECELVEEQNQGQQRSAGQRLPHPVNRSARYQPYIAHPKRPQHLPYNGCPSTANFGFSTPIQKKPVSEAEKELKDSSHKLLGAVMGRFADNADHQKRFEKEVSTSKTVNSLVEQQLTFVGDLHPLLQTALLIGEKFYRTKF